ncbi:MAG TPA: riboflavin synthase [bacterium]|nr:riboflavin synthase [bacterium]
MFTGIIEEIGTVVSLDATPAGTRLVVRSGGFLADARVGESIAVSGACLTVVNLRDGEFATDLSAETMRRTTLRSLRPGDPVNLERPLRLDQRLGGHLVQGHVDGVGTITALHAGGWMEITPPPELMRYLAEKGSVAVDGVSLTIASLEDSARFAVALIPHTLAVTTLGRRGCGSEVNIEVDILSKYVERLLGGAREP